jgi:lipoprotein-anchoring transpeptidase ErfK/SrfK
VPLTGERVHLYPRGTRVCELCRPRRDGWLGVLSEERPNGRAGWIRAADAELLREPFRLRVDLSARRLTVRREGEVVRRIAVGVGAGATPTPTGRFAVTDLLEFADAGSPYGCCALALSGRQPAVPQGWTGGDRLAIHGTRSAESVGQARSLGCLRARERDLRWLLRRIPLGTRVDVRA